MKKQGLMNGLIDWNNRNVCLSVFLQFRLAGWLAEVLRRRCFLCFILKATSSSSGVCTFSNQSYSRVSNPIPRVLKKTSRLLGVCLSSVLDTKVFWGKKIVRRNQWCLFQVYRSQESSPCWPCLCLVSMELQTCCLPLCPLWTRRRVFFHSPVFSCSAPFSSEQSE